MAKLKQYRVKRGRKWFRSRECKLYKPGDLVVIPVPGTKEFKAEFGAQAKSLPGPLEEIPKVVDPVAEAEAQLEADKQANTLSQVQAASPQGVRPSVATGDKGK
jgi:hypothetical protein